MNGKYYQITKFTSVGMVNTFADVVIMNILMLTTGITSGYLFAVFKTFSFLVGAVNSYLLNKRWTFKFSEKSSKEVVIKFALVTVVGLIINVSVSYFLVSRFNSAWGVGTQSWANISILVAVAASMIWNFLNQKFWIFKTVNVSESKKIKID